MSESKFTSKFIVIEGLIGVGKTTLCKILQRERDAQLILEPAEDNPFLASFYADPKRFAFPAQMFYLHSRTLQQNKLLQPSLFKHLFVSDYIFAKYFIINLFKPDRMNWFYIHHLHNFP